jgi:hypothetical protein
MTVHYLLDTDWVIHYLNAHQGIVARLNALLDDGLGLSVVSLAELYEGVYYSRDPEGDEQDLHDFLRGVTILGIDESRRSTMMPQPEGEVLSFHFTDTASLPWRASTTVEGVEVKDLGTANGQAMELVRCRPGTVFPPHCHTGPEFIYLLEGEAIQHGQRLRPGWAGVAAAGTIDENFHSATGCVFLIISSVAQTK